MQVLPDSDSMLLKVYRLGNFLFSKIYILYMIKLFLIVNRKQVIQSFHSYKKYNIQ